MVTASETLAEKDAIAIFLKNKAVSDSPGLLGVFILFLKVFFIYNLKKLKRIEYL